MIGSMTDPGYLRTAAEYRRVVEQRNAALKGRAARDEMAAWNERLAATGVDLTLRRRKLVASIEIEMLAQARDLESPFDFTMRYDSSLHGSEPPGDAALLRAFHEKLAAVAHEEARRGVTSSGPTATTSNSSWTATTCGASVRRDSAGCSRCS
jgi:recombinational DNA repair ATPase RecF